MDAAKNEKPEDFFAESPESIEQLKYQLLIQNVLLDDFFNNSPSGYVNVDEHGIIQKANVTLLDWLGYTRKELLSFSKLSRLMIDEEDFVFESNFLAILKGATTNNLEVALRKKNGQILYAYMSGKIVSPPDEKKLIRFTIVDVTEKKQIEKDLAEKSKAIYDQNSLMRKELILAAGIQNAFLPKKNVTNFISTLYLPLETVGGDFFDFLFLKNPNKIGIFISDVAGHGVASAFITAIIKSSLHQMTDEVLENPAEVLSNLNDVILSFSEGRFVTALYAVIDFEKSEMNCAHAGHPLPYVFSMDSVRELKLTKTRKPLGILSSSILKSKNWAYSNEIVNLNAFSRILFFTDGLLEACSEKKGLLFYEDLLHDYLKEHRTESSRMLVEGIYTDMISFLEGSTLTDDICLVSVDLTSAR